MNIKTLIFVLLFVSGNAGHFPVEKKVLISEMTPFLKGIEEAEGTVLLGAYKLHSHIHPNQEIIAAIKRSNAEEFMLVLEDHLTKEEEKEGSSSVQQGDSFKQYQELGVNLIGGSPLYKATHYKILATKKYAFLGTTNFDKDFNENGIITRDFSLILQDPKLLQELFEVFSQDLAGKPPELTCLGLEDILPGGSRLTWGPEQHRTHLGDLIKRATHSIEIYQQALQDQALTDLLVEAIGRGVKVHILMSEFPFGAKHGNKSAPNQLAIVQAKSPDGENLGKVSLTNRLHIHAKVLLVDGEDPEKAMMYLGSANFYQPALDFDRNVGVITKDHEYIQPVRQQFVKDWVLHQ